MRHRGTGVNIVTEGMLLRSRIIHVTVIARWVMSTFGVLLITSSRSFFFALGVRPLMRSNVQELSSSQGFGQRVGKGFVRSCDLQVKGTYFFAGNMGAFLVNHP